MKRRYFIYLSYNGAAYHGWQVQPNGVSVQDVVEKALAVVLRQKIDVTGAGRTDTGVHARMMTAHFDAEIADLQLDELTKKLNSLLPADIAVHKIEMVKPTAHARFDAISRTYEYHIVTSKNVFLNGLTARFSEKINFEKMNEAAVILLEYNDFTSFSKLHTDVKTNLCNITFARWEQHEDKWIFTITANRFLRNMVRAIVGTLLDVGRGKIDLQDFRKIIENKNRCTAGTSVPAEGLYLIDIKYDEIELKNISASSS
jgi:tRNA pseudouridine38-40 synthase